MQATQKTAMNELSEYYRNLRDIPKPASVKKEPHKGNWNLVLHIGGLKQTVLADRPYAACVARKNQIMRDPSVRKGSLKIEPHKPTSK
jgi:hypothetical protein